MTTWLLSRDQGPHGLKVAKIRLTQPPPAREDGNLPVHPGRDWFTVLTGTVVVPLGDRTIKVSKRSGRRVLDHGAAHLRRTRRTR